MSLTARFKGLLRYGAAVLAVGLGFAAWWGIRTWIGPGLPTFITFYPAVMLVALLGGLGPGLFATALTELAVAYWIILPAGQFSLGSPIETVALALFAGMGIFISAVAELYRRSRLKAAAYDREQALREMRREKEFLANLLENAAQPFAVGYPDGGLGLCNHAYELLTGYTAAELQTLDWSTTLTPPEWREAEKRKLEELHRTQQAVRYQKEYLRKDGSRVPVELFVHLLADATGKPEFYYCFVEDITERKRAESALRRSERRYRSFVDVTSQFAWVTDPNGQVVEDIPALRQFTGQTYEQAKGAGWADALHPEDLPRTLEVWQRAVSTRTPYETEYRMRRHDGIYRLLLARGVPIFDDQGNVTEWVGTCIDITERRRAEEALRESELFHRQTLESIPGMVFTTRPDGYCDYQSQQWVEFTGVPMKEHLGDGWNKLLHPDDQPRAFAAWRAAVEDRAPYDLEYRVRRHDGQYEWFKVIGRPIRDASGQIVRWFGVAANINELRQAQEQLHRHAEDLEKIVASRTAKLHETIAELEHFSYAIVHDMRAPLRAMQGFATMIEEECGQCERTLPKQYFRRIKIASNRMDQLIADSLSYGQAARQEMDLEAVDLFQLLDGLVQTYPNLQPDQADIRIETDLPTVLGNQAALTQCFSNLLGNAVKFAKPGTKPQIHVWAERGRIGGLMDKWIDGTEGSPHQSANPSVHESSPVFPHSSINPSIQPPHDHVRIWVEDQGIGIPKIAQERIFGLFQRATTKHEGTGIGLAIVRKVVERIGGKVGVESQPGQGSRFWVELPLA